MSYDRRAYILHQKDFFDTNSLPKLMTMARKKINHRRMWILIRLEIQFSLDTLW
jgi:hypothetical protein